MSKVYIIAEAGVNHNGDSELAFKLIDVAVEAGASAVKFQTFNAENVVTSGAKKANYQLKNTDRNESQFAMLNRLALKNEMHYKLNDYCEENGIDFLSSAFDKGSLDFLVNDLGLETLKIPSGEITNGPLLLAYSQKGLNLIISTGMATLGEVEESLGVIAFGLIHHNDINAKPSREAFHEAYVSSQGQSLLKEKVTLLHCTSEYPAPFEDINLKAMLTMRQSFGLKTGYSDHSEGITVPIIAATMGAILIEKHFTLDKNLAGPDHRASLEPTELKEMVTEIRKVEQVMGNGMKAPRPSEMKNLSLVRKSLIAKTKIMKGDYFSTENLSIKRPGTGKSPMEYWNIIGEKAKQNYQIGEVINKNG